MVIDISNLISYIFISNSLRKYLDALLIFVISLAVLRIFKYVVLKKLKEISARTAMDYDDLLVNVIDAFGWPFYLLISLYIAFQFIVLPGKTDTVLYYLIIILGIFYAVRGIHILIDYGTQKLISIKKEEERKEGEEGRTDTSIIDFSGRLLKIIVWIAAFILILSNIGYNVTALIAGLGIGGLAIAIALQNILNDIFASFSIYFDKPFKVGDYITFGDESGTVKRIGIKTTRIQTPQGEELIISNKQLIESRVHNYKKMELRRVVFNLNIGNETPNEKLEKIPVIIKEIIDKAELVKFDRAHFIKFTDFNLNFEIVYYVLTRNYNIYMDIQHKINLGIKERLEEEGIEMPYPTQNIIMKGISNE